MASMACELGVPYQFCVQLCAPVQALPGTRMKFVAPALRMAVMAALAASRHCSVSIELGSFIRLKITWSFVLYWVATRDQKSANTELGTAAVPIARAGSLCMLPELG